MPAKRRSSKKRLVISPELRPLAERLVQLHEDHHRAATGDAGPSFYDDGRHQELVDLIGIVDVALGIMPWEDGEEILREALGRSAAQQEPSPWTGSRDQDSATIGGHTRNNLGPNS